MSINKITQEQGTDYFIHAKEVSERLFAVEGTRAVLVEFIILDTEMVFMVRLTVPAPGVTFEVNSESCDSLGRWDCADFYIFPAEAHNVELTEKVAKRFALSLLM